MLPRSISFFAAEYTAKFGEPMVYTELYGPDLGEDVYVGLFACAALLTLRYRQVSGRAVRAATPALAPVGG